MFTLQLASFLSLSAMVTAPIFSDPVEPTSKKDTTERKEPTKPKKSLDERRDELERKHEQGTIDEVEYVRRFMRLQKERFPRRESIILRQMSSGPNTAERNRREQLNATYLVAGAIAFAGVAVAVGIVMAARKRRAA